MMLLKVALHNYLKNILLVNPRKDHWILNSIQIYFLMKYVEINYPDMKFFGVLSNIWGLRAFHAANLHYNDKYTLAMRKRNRP